MDIVTDGLGFMLVVGNYCWVPFTFSIQSRYLAFHPVELGWAKVAAIIGVNFFGYWIFRSSNAEKNNFRNGKNPKSQYIRHKRVCRNVHKLADLSFMETKRGTRLLTSGWWGLSRHPNYM